MQNIRSGCIAAALSLALAACGGGGGGGTAGIGPQSPASSTPSSPEPRISLSDREREIYEADAEQGRTATLEAVGTAPRFGSVTQSSNADSGTTTDQASATYQDGKLTVTVTQQDSSSFTFNTDDAVDSESSTSAANGLKVTSTTYVKETGTGDEMETILAHTAHFSTGEEATDWMAGGYWLKLAGDIGAGTIDNVEVGAFVDGPELRGTTTLPVRGSATYRGEANGLYTAVYGTGADEPEGSYEFGRYQGDLELLAHFGSHNQYDHGWIGGSIRNIGIAGVLVRDGSVQENNVERMTDYHVNFGPAAIEENGRWSSSTNVRLNQPGTNATSSGSWAGQVSKQADADGIPRLVAGTNGITATLPGGTTTSMVGSFYGWKVESWEK